MAWQFKLNPPLPFLALGCILLTIVVGATGSQSALETVVVVVRHAEKRAMPSDDPPLSDAGRNRAKALAHVLADAGVTAIFATQFQRTHQTIEPTAQALGIPVTQVDATKIEMLVGQVLEEHRGEVVLVAGHSNTVPEIIAALGGGKIPPIDESAFDDLFIVTVPKNGSARILHLKYGAAD